MPLEIERKFLVVSPAWRRLAGPGRRFCQGYIAKTPRGTVRVRRVDDSATLAIKGRRKGFSRREFEFAIPVDQAELMLQDLCAKPLIEKVRYEVRHAGLTWEIDVYCGKATGLVLAEVELDHEHQAIELPDWAGTEVTHDLRYRNSAIAAGEWRSNSMPAPDEIEARWPG
jgi:CYTH domain-containing protein